MIFSKVFWFTGLSGVGKTTVANSVKEIFEQKGYRVLVLDGDNVRQELHQHLGFSPSEIKQNNLLIAKLCRKHRCENDIIFVPIISPYRESRSLARSMLRPDFYEIHFDADIEILCQRDTKGLYAMAQQGKIENLIGVSGKNVYEAPVEPDLYLNTGSLSEEEATKSFTKFVDSKMDLKAMRI